MTSFAQAPVSGEGNLLLTNPVGVGNTLVYAGGLRGGSPFSIPGFTASSLGSTTDGENGIGIFYRGPTTGAESQYLLGSPAASSLNGTFYEVVGDLTEDQADEVSGTGVTLATGSITVAADSFVVGVGVQGHGGAYDSVATAVSYAIGAGWTEDYDHYTTGGHPTVITGHRFDAGSYAYSATNELPSGDAWIVQVASFSGPSTPGGAVGGTDDGDPWIDLTSDIVSWTITRGASPEVTGAAQAGTATIVVRRLNRDGRYNPRNAASDLYGILRDGCRVHISVNDDGTLTAGGTAVGLFAGRISDISQVLTGLDDPTPLTEIVCEDPLAWYARTPARVADSRTRSHHQLRLDVLAAISETRYDLASEIGTMPLSSADGNAFEILGRINGANGTRHFAKPSDNHDDWYRYTTRNRQYKLAGVADQSIDAASVHASDTSGWRLSADTVTNQQKASVDATAFLDAARIVWQHDALPLVVEGTLELFATLPDYVDAPTVESQHTGSSATVTLTPFGSTAKLVIVSSGTTTFQMLRIRGYEVIRGDAQSYVADDLTSQAGPRGVRAGSEITGDYVGVLAMARGIAQHVVWRYGNPQLRPTLTVENWFPYQFTLDLFDTIAVTTGQMMATAVIFEIVGLTHTSDVAAAAPGPVHHTTTYVLQESRVQEATAWFTLDTSHLDGADVLAY